MLEGVEASDEERGADEQGQRERGLDSDEHGSCPTAARCRAAGAASDAQITRASRLERRHEGAHRRARKREDHADDERHRTNAELGGPRHTRGGGRADEKVARPQRHRETGHRRE